MSYSVTTFGEYRGSLTGQALQCVQDDDSPRNKADLQMV